MMKSDNYHGSGAISSLDLFLQQQVMKGELFFFFCIGFLCIDFCSFMCEREGTKRITFYLEQNMMSFTGVCYHHYASLKKQTMIIEFPQSWISAKRIQKIDPQCEEKPYQS